MKTANMQQKLIEKLQGFPVVTLLFFVTIIFYEFLFKQIFFVPLSQTKVLYSLVYAMLFSSLTFIAKKERTRQRVFMTIIVIITLLFLIEGVHFRAFRSLALLDALLRLGTLAGVADSIFEFISPDLLLFAIPLLLYWLMSRKEMTQTFFRKKYDYKKILLLFLVAALTLTGLNQYHVYVKADRNKKHFQNSSVYLREYGLIDTLFKEVGMAIFAQDQEMSVEEIAELEATFAYTPDKNTMTNRYKGKNIVYIEAESIAPYAIDKDLTPFLYKLQQEGLNFTNYYSSRLNTFDSEYAMINSFQLSPEKQRSEFTKEGTMPTLFKDQGYSADSFHDYKKTSYARAMRYPELGFDTFYGATDLNLDDTQAPDFPSDEDFFRETFPLYAKKEQPFLGYHITVSAHASYTEKDRPGIAENLKKVEKVYPMLDREGQIYLAASMQTDQGVGQLFKDLEENDLYDDTVIVFVGDHYPYALPSQVVNDQFGVEPGLEMYKVPFIIWDASKPAREERMLGTNVDILPTLANLFDLDLQYAMGHDLYSENADNVIVEWHDIRSYSFLTPRGGYDGDADVVYGDLTKEEVAYYQEVTYKRERWSNSEHVREKLLR